MKISSKLNELKPTDLNCNVFDVYSYEGLSMQELLCQFFTKINECIKVSNETIDLASWLVNEGLKIEVVNKLMMWLEDGTLENIINVNLFNTLHTKIESIENFKKDISSTTEILICESDSFDVEFSKHLTKLRESDSKYTLYIGGGEYNVRKNHIIDFNANIILDKYAKLNIYTDFLTLQHSDINVDLRGELNIKADGVHVVTLNDSVQSDKAIINCNISLNLKTDLLQNNIVGVKVNKRSWKNIFNIFSKNISYPLQITGLWFNSNKVTGKYVGFKKGITINNTMTAGNIIELDMEQVRDNETTYGVYYELGKTFNNKFFINHWLDNNNGKYITYTAQSDDFHSNLIEGEIEGLISINQKINYLNCLFFTKRDRSVKPGDTGGTYNQPLITNFYKKNLCKLNNFDLFETPEQMGIMTNNDKVKVEFVHDSELNKKVLKITQISNDGVGFATYDIFNSDFINNTYTLSCLLKYDINNNHNNYPIWINDGNKSTNSTPHTPIDGEWTRVNVTHKNTTSRLQLNLGRRNGSTTNFKGDIIYISEIMITKGEHTFSHFTEHIDNNFITCKTLPTATAKHHGKVMLLETDDLDEVYLCVRKGLQGYLWKKINIEQ